MFVWRALTPEHVIRHPKFMQSLPQRFVPAVMLKWCHDCLLLSRLSASRLSKNTSRVSERLQTTRVGRYPSNHREIIRHVIV